MQRKIIGIVGLIGSGKDTVAEYIAKKYGYDVINMSDLVREAATKLGKTHGRFDLQLTQKEYRDKYGMEYFGEQVVKKIIMNNMQKIVVTSIRIIEDIIPQKQEFGKEMTIVFVDSDPRIRFERLHARGTERDPKTFEEFLIQEKNEFKFFNFDKAIEFAEHKIDNSGTLGELHAQVDEFMKKARLV